MEILEIWTGLLNFGSELIESISSEHQFDEDMMNISNDDGSELGRDAGVFIKDLVPSFTMHFRPLLLSACMMRLSCVEDGNLFGETVADYVYIDHAEEAA